MAGQRRSLVLITLAPRPIYGNFLQSIRKLRSLKKCNVLVREDGEPIKAQAAPPDSLPDRLAIPALVLCGSAIGDAGFTGTLPPDGVVRL
jgi:hypothetical protein